MFSKNFFYWRGSFWKKNLCGGYGFSLDDIWIKIHHWSLFLHTKLYKIQFKNAIKISHNRQVFALLFSHYTRRVVVFKYRHNYISFRALQYRMLIRFLFIIISFCFQIIRKMEIVIFFLVSEFIFYKKQTSIMYSNFSVTIAQFCI